MRTNRSARPVEAMRKQRIPLCLLLPLLALLISACQPPSRTPGLPTRAYRGPAVQATAVIPSSAAATLTDPIPALPDTAAPSETVPPPPLPSDTPLSTETPPPLPSATATPTPILSPTVTPTQAREQIGEVPSDDGQEPVYFPADDDPLEGWEALTRGIAPPSVQWADYSGPVDSSQPDTPVNITFRYPSQWTASSSNSSRRISLRSAPENPSQTQAELVKFEILPQASRPVISSEQTGDFQEHAVDVAGDPALLIVYTQDPEKQQLLSVIFQHNRDWYIVVGSIQLDQPDQARVDQLRSLLYAMFQSMRITP